MFLVGKARDVCSSLVKKVRDAWSSSVKKVQEVWSALVEKVRDFCPAWARVTLIKNWTILYLVTFGFILPLFFGSCNRSLYFTLRKQFVSPSSFQRCFEHQDRVRLKEAREYFEQASPETVRAAVNNLAGNHSSAPDIVITVSTANREKGKTQSYTPDYLAETASKLLSQLTNKQIMSNFPYSIKLMLCNGGADPSMNEAAIRLGRYIDIVTMPSKTRPETLIDMLEYEKIDYMVCLNESLKLSPRYVIALEDDAIPTDDMWTLLKYAISHRLDKRIYQDRTITDTSQTAFVKLYYPERRMGYLKPGVQQNLELVGLSMVLGTLLTMLHEAIRKCSLWPKDHTEYSLLTLFAWCLYVALVALAIGRPCLLEFRRLLPPHFYTFVPASQNYTQAVLFPNHGAKLLVQHLNKTRITESYGKDTIMENMLGQTNMKAYQLYPNIVIHIGHKSTRHDNISPYGIT